MMTDIPEDQQKNYNIFLDCLSTALVEKTSQPERKPKRRSKSKKSSSTSPALTTEPTSTPTRDGSKPPSTSLDQYPDLEGVNDLADFAEYIASSTFIALPPELKTLDYYIYAKSPDLQTHYALPLTGTDIPTLLPTLDPAVADSLSAYGVTCEITQGIYEFLAPVLTRYLECITKPPPPPRTTLREAEGCELCGRSWVPLSYHHLIPRFVHTKAVKRGWHREEDLQNVAWLCGACHRFVHRFAGHEDLARQYYTVELLMAEEQVRRWAEWVGRLRWKGR